MYAFMLLYRPCPGGEIGRHARLKILWAQARAGSIPALDTIKECWLTAGFFDGRRESKTLLLLLSHVSCIRRPSHTGHFYFRLNSLFNFLSFSIFAAVITSTLLLISR